MFGEGKLWKYTTADDDFEEVTGLPSGIDYEDPTSVGMLVTTCLEP